MSSPGATCAGYGFLTRAVTSWLSLRNRSVKFMHTIATAAAAVGRSKTAILRAINDGRIPVSRSQEGDVQIDPADLHRVYPPLRTGETQHRLYQSPLLLPVGG